MPASCRRVNAFEKSFPLFSEKLDKIISPYPSYILHTTVESKVPGIKFVVYSFPSRRYFVFTLLPSCALIYLMIVSESFSPHFKSSNEIISSLGFKPFLSAVELIYTLDTTKFLFSFK